MTAVLPRAGRDVDVLFDPVSVAVVGASDDESKYGNWIAVQALRMLGRRPVHLVNRRGGTVVGRPAARSLAELAEPVDLVVVAVPAAGFEAAVDDALAAGARAVVGITAGFAELGAEGRAVQQRVAERVRAAGAVLLGPNCLGVADSTTALTLASNPLPAGTVSLLSQSGNMALELSGFLTGHGLGFARFASLGNQADVGVADLIRSCTRHEGTELIAVYCEDFGDGRDFVDAAVHARTAGKPVVLLTVGGSAASVRGAASHTGSLTSDSDVIDAACRAAGIYRVATPRELADLAATLRQQGPVEVHRVAVLADGGGHASVAADVTEAAGLAVPEFSARLSEALRRELPPSAGVRNPIDLAGAGEQDITSFARVLEVTLAEPDTDAVLLTGYFGGYREYGERLAAGELATARRMAALVRGQGKPVVVHTMRPDSPAARVLAERGVPVFGAVEQAARALALLASAPAPAAPAALPAPAEPVTDDGYWPSRALFAAAGVPFPAGERVTTGEEALAAARRIGYPVVLKAEGLLHKSDSGGVALGLSTPDELSAALADMHNRLRPPGYSVEAMADLGDAVELIAGVRRDPRFGPVVMVGLGGVFTEVLADVAFALAPVDRAGAERLLRGLRASALLTGVRGRPAVDLRGAADVVATISSLAAAHPEIAELEINPLLAAPGRVTALDARIVRIED
ncbi:acetate--CoA ligase family protein [Amycolatopsis granulosa]|uniref:acetate--CoA ligase family protein n=1 Tax=Amycolatopsis granulosa TaxID=185684 RepID=UPI00142497A8|nr:acetate--CoA ligase family protein [Amycolatopsis granulosa]NIH83268.1 acyl-CoA synthetase (NDP forming) [Amycolatopsis granulosa]